MAYDYTRDAKVDPRHDPANLEQANRGYAVGGALTTNTLSPKTSGMDSAKDQQLRAGEELEQALSALYQRLEAGGVLKDQPPAPQTDRANARPTALSSMARFIDDRTDHLRSLTGKVVTLIGLLDI